MSDAVRSPDAPPPSRFDVTSELDAAPIAVVEAGARTEAIELLRATLADVPVVMLTAACNGLHSRPLTLLRVDAEGGLWFLCDAGEGWVQALVDHPLVDVSAEVHRDGLWISVSGIAVLSDDRRAIGELWTEPAAAFWESPDDPRVRVLRVDPNELDVWRTAPTALGRALEIGRAILTGDADEADVGTHDHRVINPLPGAEHAV